MEIQNKCYETDSWIISEERIKDSLNNINDLSPESMQTLLDLLLSYKCVYIDKSHKENVRPYEIKVINTSPVADSP